MKNVQFFIKIRLIGFLVFAAFLAGCAFTAKIPKTPAEVGDDLILQVDPSKTKVFIGEKIILTYVVSTRLDLRYEGFENDGRFPQFWLEEFPIRNLKREVVTLNNKKYIKVAIRKRALFPIDPGMKKIQPGTIKFTVAKHLNLMKSVDPIEIQVENFPTSGKPSSFTGSSGNYTMEAAIKEGSIPGEYVLTVTVLGEGNFRNLKLPELNFDADFSLIRKEEKVISHPDWSNDVPAGKKQFIFVLAAQKIGQLKIREIMFSYFNPEKKQYETLKTPELLVSADQVLPMKPKANPKRLTAKSSTMLLLDVSASMLAQDFKPKDRLTSMKEAVKKTLSTIKPDDAVGIKMFGSEVITLSSVANVDQSLIAKIDEMDTGPIKEGTAMGSAIFEGSKDLKREGVGRKKAIILITDGTNNSGYIDLVTAANIAAKEHFPVHVVAVGGTNETVRFPMDDPKKGTVIVDAKMHADYESLQEIAKITGGKYYRVQDESQLLSVMSEIQKGL